MKLIILLGAPGSGKGTASNILIDKHKCLHLSTGKILREISKEEMQEIQKNLPKNQQSDQKCMNKGAYLSDDLINLVIKQKLSEIEKFYDNQLIILDGYPRTLNQALYLDKNFPLFKVFYIGNLNDEIIISRLNNRYICEASEHIFNIKEFDIDKHQYCVHDGSKLYQREDDKPEIIKKRIDIYNKMTFPLLEHYRKKNIVIDIDGNCSSEELYKRIICHLE